MWTGYTDRETEDRYVSELSGKVMAWQDWAEGQPNDWGGKEDCISYVVERERLRDNSCPSNNVAMVCRVPQSSKYMLRGVCTDSPADSFYVVRNRGELLGYSQSKMVLSITRGRWEIQFTKGSLN